MSDLEDETYSMNDTFMTSEGPQFSIKVNDGDESLGISGESTDEAGKERGPLREQDLYLPLANVARIMKNAIPKSGKIAKDAKECVQECVSEFVSFITSEASERCQQEKRKTINGEDILFAMSTLGFDNYVEPLKLYLQRYREVSKGDKNESIASATNSSFEDTEDVEEIYTTPVIAARILPNQEGQQSAIYTFPSQIMFPCPGGNI